MNHRFEVSGRLPGMNEYINACRTHAQKGNRMKREVQDIISWYAGKGLGRVQIGRPVVIHYRFYEPDRRRDLDNISGFFHKVCQDALVEGGYLKDDGWKQVRGYTDSFYVDRKRPRIEVELEELGGLD